MQLYEYVTVSFIIKIRIVGITHTKIYIYEFNELFINCKV